MKKRVTKVIAAASMAALTALQCTVTVFADVPAGTDQETLEILFPAPPQSPV